MSVQVPNGVGRHRGRGRGRGRRRRQAVPLLLPGPAAGLDVRRPAPAAPRRSRRTGCASTTCASVIETLADEGSVLELRRAFGLGMVTALIRIEGRPIGVVANNPMHLAGAIDSRRLRQGRALPAALRRLRPAGAVPVRHAGHHGRARRSRRPALVRHCSRLFVTGANLDACRSSRSCCARPTAWARRRWPAAASMPAIFAVSWPTGEFGGMGLEGAVKLGYRKELAAIDDPDERRATVRRDGRGGLRARQGAQSPRPISRSTRSSIRPIRASWVATGLLGAERRPGPARKRRPYIDTW